MDGPIELSADGLSDVILEDWMAERLSREAANLRALTNRSRLNREFRTSPEIAAEVDNTTESLAFCFNWIADGQPVEFLASLGFDWHVLTVGAPAQRVTLQLQAVEGILGDSQLVEHLEFDYDAFISHASEDKNDFVRPLVEELVSRDLRIWYDEHSLEVGQSLRENIDSGLARSRFGIVVLSPAFLRKNWAQHELNGLVARQMEGARVILPVWYNITHEAILQYSPPLADAVALDAARNSIDEIGTSLFNKIKGIRKRRKGP